MVYDMQGLITTPLNLGYKLIDSGEFTGGMNNFRKLFMSLAFLCSKELVKYRFYFQEFNGSVIGYKMKRIL